MKRHLGLWILRQAWAGQPRRLRHRPLTAIVRTRLKSIQYRPALIEAFIAETGLAIQPQPP